MSKTNIEWTESVWNPVRGCTRISQGCEHCYAESIASRFSKPGQWGHGFAEMHSYGPRWTGDVELIRGKLDEPMAWRAPRMVFVNSTSDLWHEKLPQEEIEEIYDVMWRADHHIYQVLTKRSDRRMGIMNAWSKGLGYNDYLTEQEHIWEGVSVEDRISLERIRELRLTPAALRWISFEPLLQYLGPVDLTDIDWIVIGGESGHGARLMEEHYLSDLIEQARDQDVPIFVKQLGSVLGKDFGCSDNKGGDIDAWPEAYKIREWPKGFDPLTGRR